MNHIILDKASDLVGSGKERNCFVHPSEPHIAIKINRGEVKKQMSRELKFYRTQLKRKNSNCKHIPQYFGEIETNYGEGHMFELVRDFDGNISKSLLEYLEEGVPLNGFESDLRILKQSLLGEQIIFNHDMYSGNILYKKTSEEEGYLVVIDGLGDTVLINWLNLFKRHRIKKIKRRWELFINRLRKRAADMTEQSDVNEKYHGIH